MASPRPPLKLPGEAAHEVRDLADFILHWPQLRPLALSAQALLAPGAEERRVVEWLVALADRVGPEDVGPQPGA